MGESKDAEKWAALARAHHHRAGQLLSPDGYYYEGFEYWIFSTPWLVHFLDAWEHATGESLWNREMFRNWKTYLAHTLLPDGQNVFDFGDIWEGALTRAKAGAEYDARLSGRHAAEQLQRHVSSGRASRGSAGAGGRRALRVVRPQQSRRVSGRCSGAIRRSKPAPMDDAAALASLRGLGCGLHAIVVGRNADRDRLQGGAAGGASRRRAAAQAARVAARQRPRPSRCRQLHRVGQRPLPDR